MHCACATQLGMLLFPWGGLRLQGPPKEAEVPVQTSVGRGTRESLELAMVRALPRPRSTHCWLAHLMASGSAVPIRRAAALVATNWNRN